MDLHLVKLHTKNRETIFFLILLSHIQLKRNKPNNTSHKLTREIELGKYQLESYGYLFSTAALSPTLVIISP